MTPSSRNRYEYKAVWTELSQTEQGARAQVIGDVDDDYMLETAEETRRWLEETVGINDDDVILEIGCGIGRVGQVLAPRCRQWIGCDVSPNMLSFARQRLAPFDNVRLVEISGFDLRPIRSSAVDLVYCTVVFMHLDEWDRYNYILEAWRVLRPGGRIFVDNFNLCSPEGWQVFEQERKVAPVRRPAAISKSSTPQEIECYLRNAGFQDIRIVEDGTWVRGFGTKPAVAQEDEHAVDDGSANADRDLADAILSAESAASSAAAAPGNETFVDPAAALSRRVGELETTIKQKNEHILYLENLIGRIESGRVMRLLRLITRS